MVTRTLKILSGLGLEHAQKSRIQETLTLLTDADSSTDTKTNRNGQKKTLFFIIIFFFFLFQMFLGVAIIFFSGVVTKISKKNLNFFLSIIYLFTSFL